MAPGGSGGSALPCRNPLLLYAILAWPPDPLFDFHAANCCRAAIVLDEAGLYWCQQLPRMAIIGINY